MRFKARWSVILWIYVFIALAVGVMGCAKSGTVQPYTNAPTGLDATFVDNTYKEQQAVATAVDTAMGSMGALYKAGKFSEANKVKAIAADTTFKTAYDAAVTALQVYDLTPTDANKSAVTSAMVALGIQAAAVTALNVAEIIGGAK